MALEDLTGNSKFITSLVASNPLSADDRREGDDHIRGVKNVLRNTFPGLDRAVDLSNDPGPFLPLTGGTLGGALVMSPPVDHAVLILNKPSWQNFKGSLIYGQTATKNRWELALGNGVNESGGNTGSDFTISRFDDAGGGVVTAFRIVRSTGSTTIHPGLVIDNTVAVDKLLLKGWGGGSGQAFVTQPCIGGLVGCAAFLNVGGAYVGSIHTSDTATLYNTTSDYRLKEAIAPMVGGLDCILAARPCKFIWKSNGEPGEGFIAHELAAVIPAAVSGAKDAVGADGRPMYQGVDLSKVVPVLVSAVQELAERVAALEAR